MKGLLLKDFYEIKDTLILLIITIVGVGMGISYLTSPMVTILISAIIMSNAVVGTIQTDKQSQWNKFTVTLPATQTTLIASKYILLTIFAVIGVLVGAVISFLFSLKSQNFDIAMLLSNVNLGFVFAFISGSISIPLSYILNEDKGVIVTLISCFVTTLAVILLALIFDNKNMLFTTTIANLVSIIIFTISCKICSNIQKNKDL
jgi:hypothetical protein